jgi:hypothetical protein
MSSRWRLCVRAVALAAHASACLARSVHVPDGDADTWEIHLETQHRARRDLLRCAARQRIVTTAVRRICANALLHHGAGRCRPQDRSRQHGRAADAHKVRDTHRHPAETLAFFGIKPNMTVIEISPGSGYYAEILSPYLKSGGGKYIATGNANGRL